MKFSAVDGDARDEARRGASAARIFVTICH